ncbi:hypothetical protein C8R47DRAFT_1100656 [Mycena vitilis]|nr:hypothetical protein C8R47DRAFT_1100656 [Mycena vitilis]
MNSIETLDDPTITVDHLRVKTCFICLEEESAPTQPDGLATNTTNPWIHPCPNCGLVAHDRCLIRWISSLPLKRSAKTPYKDRSGSVFVLDTFRCPQCRRPYELAHQPSLMHRLLMVFDAVYVLVSELGQIGSLVVGLTTFQMLPAAVFAQSRMLASAGLLVHEIAFLRVYLGSRMFKLLLTDNFRDLYRSIFIVAPMIPLRIMFPGTSPRWIMPLYLSFPLILHGMTKLVPSEGLIPLESEVPTASGPMISFWPPSPSLIGYVGTCIISPVYNHFFARFSTWVLGAPPPRRQRTYLNDRLGAHARAFFTLRRVRPPRAAVLGADPDNDADPPPLLLAAQLVQKDQSSFTHDVVHAVFSLFVPRLFGGLLHAASGHSSYLRRFLGLRPAGMPLSSGVIPHFAALGWGERVWTALKPSFALVCLGGSWIWTDVDPVWWRTSLGYGIFVMAKDSVELYRLWLQKKEVQSRTIKSRDFAGVDISELDLVAPERFAAR